MTKTSDIILHHCFFYIFSDIKKKRNGTEMALSQRALQL